MAEQIKRREWGEVRMEQGKAQAGEGLVEKSIQSGLQKAFEGIGTGSLGPTVRQSPSTSRES